MTCRAACSISLILSLAASVACGKVTLAPDAQPQPDAAPLDCSQCDPSATCDDSTEPVTCECEPGYTGDGLTCEDIDECAEQNGGCHPEAQCINLPGTRSCLCPPGYVGDGMTCELQWEKLYGDPDLDLDLGYGINAASLDSRIYFAPEVPDGSNTPPYFKSVDVSTGTANEETPMPPATDDFCACGYGGWLVGHQGYLHYFANYGQVYDGSTWTEVAYTFDNQRGEAATAVAMERIFMVGGRGTLQDAQYYSGGPAGQWSLPGTVATPPWGVEDAAAAGDGNLLYVFGGTTDTGAENKAARYDAAANSWTELPDIPVSASRPRGAGVARGMPFVMAGNAIHFFDPDSNTWTEPVNTPPNGYFVPVVVNTDLYIVGEQNDEVVIYRLAVYP